MIQRTCEENLRGANFLPWQCAADVCTFEHILFIFPCIHKFLNWPYDSKFTSLKSFHYHGVKMWNSRGICLSPVVCPKPPTPQTNILALWVISDLRLLIVVPFLYCKGLTGTFGSLLWFLAATAASGWFSGGTGHTKGGSGSGQAGQARPAANWKLVLWSSFKCSWKAVEGLTRTILLSIQKCGSFTLCEAGDRWTISNPQFLCFSAGNCCFWWIRLRFGRCCWRRVLFGGGGRRQGCETVSDAHSKNLFFRCHASSSQSDWLS